MTDDRLREAAQAVLRWHDATKALGMSDPVVIDNLRSAAMSTISDRVRALRERVMCDECGLPDRCAAGTPGHLAPWPHPARYRATVDERSHGIPYHYPEPCGTLETCKLEDET